MPQYIAIPRATSNPFEVIEVALTASLKTVLQVKPVTKDLVICGWGISTDGNASGTPFVADLCATDVAATVTALTPDLWENEDAVAALAVGGTSATGYNASAEGTIAAFRMFDAQEIRPDGDKYVMWFPLKERPKVAAGGFARVRAHYSATGVNCLPWLVFDET
jgi:hypothetical protein